MACVSIIVPIYNVERYLPQCIESILQQTFTDIELILVDDGSPDSCGQICDQYAQQDNRICVIHTKNSGVSAARNTALQIASGQFVTFCDSDDYYQPDWIENLVIAMQESDVDLVFGNYTRITDQGEIMSMSQFEAGFFDLHQYADKIQYYLDKVFTYRHGWEVWTRLFRREIIQKNGILFCETCAGFAEDLGFVLEYLLYARHCLCIEASGYCYRCRSGSMMQTSRDVVRLDSVSEVGNYFIIQAKKVLPREYRAVLPMIFFLIMHNQYCKITGTERYCKLKEEIKKIRNYNQWKKNTRAILRTGKTMQGYLGKFSAGRILLLTRYCLHGNWNIFKIDSAIFYRTHKEIA